ncbi:MAG: hypothetical protein DI552_02995 [Brevundimonas sp.]|nr:MAG: hypothetical protein DI552_02995 [Brevundimonas sp.]
MRSDQILHDVSIRGMSVFFSQLIDHRFDSWIQHVDVQLSRSRVIATSPPHDLLISNLLLVVEPDQARCTLHVLRHSSHLGA